MMRKLSLSSVVCVFLTGFFLVAPVVAQKKKKKGPPKPVLAQLRSRDGVLVQATYYAGTKGKKSIPIILLHDYEGNRNDWRPLAVYFQRLGHACLIPDLRGHGQSTKTVAGGTIDIERMRRKHFEAMVLDVEAAKGYLMKEHNKGNVNIETLTVVGAGMGSVVGLNWAVRDWNAQPLPAFKQGQDVKALILMSPKYAFKGMTTRLALAHRNVAGQLFKAIVVGARDKKLLRDAKRMHSTFKRKHPKLKGDDAEQFWAKSVFMFSPDTKLQGTRLIRPGISYEGVTLANFMRGFLEQKVIPLGAKIPWKPRRNPASEDDDT